MRKIARQKYLEEREQKKMIELQDTIEDEEYLFSDVKLTEIEKQELEYKKTVYELAKERVTKVKDVERYMLPEAYDDPENKKGRKHRYDVLEARYGEEAMAERRSGGGSYLPPSEQDIWEGEQMKHSKTTFGAREGKKKNEQDEYELIIENQVDFIMEDMLDGNLASDVDDDEETEAEKKHKTLQEVRKSLPIYPFREALLEAVREYQVLIIEGETGSGKTTQIPQYLYEEGFCKSGKLACTQPRRVAAMSVAARVAQEMGVKLGNEVGYSIRFEDCSTERTKIKYMTDGMMLREFLGEPDMASYSVILVDEAHERTLHTDILFGLVKDIARFRPDIKLLISSATLDAHKFQVLAEVN